MQPAASSSSVVSAAAAGVALPPPMYNPFALQRQQQQEGNTRNNDVASMLLGPPPSTPPRTVLAAATAPASSPPVNPQLLAAYTHFLARASPSPSASPSPASVSSSAASSSNGASAPAAASQSYPNPNPKRTVLSVVTSAYLADDPLRAQAPDGFDPLQPNRGGRSQPKTAVEFWRFVEPYFALPSARELEMLSVCAWPQQDEVVAQMEAEAAESTVATAAASVGQSSSQAARAARRAPAAPLSTVDQLRADRQQIVLRLERQEAEQEQKLKLEEMLHEAAAQCNKPDSAASAASAADATATAMTDAAVPDSQMSLAPSDSQNSEMQLSPSSLVTVPLASSSTATLAARRRFLDSRAAAQALEGGLSIRLRELTDEQVRMLMAAVWTKMKASSQSMVRRRTRQARSVASPPASLSLVAHSAFSDLCVFYAQFHAIDLSPDCVDAALNACAAFLSSLPPRVPRALAPPAPADTSARPAYLNSVPRPINAMALYPAKIKPDGEEDEEEEDKLLDVERLNLAECLEQLDLIEASNIVSFAPELCALPALPVEIVR